MNKLTQLLTLTGLILLSSSVFAETATAEKSRLTQSRSYSAADVGTTAKGVLSTQSLFTSNRQPQLKRGSSRVESGSAKPRAQTKSHLCSGCSDPDYILDNASVVLTDDHDGDGYYPWLSVRFDIDKYGFGEWVYAELFLSYEGGPWNHYATTGEFFVQGFTVLDEHIVETELLEGFPTGYYDVRVELYHAEDDGWLTSFGPGDDYSLSSLPLEDNDNDDYYYGPGYDDTYVEFSGGGSTGLLFIAAMLLMLTYRFTTSSRSPRYKKA